MKPIYSQCQMKTVLQRSRIITFLSGRDEQVWRSEELRMRCQMARGLARLSVDQSCCSHVRGITFLSIPPYPAAQAPDT